MTVRGIFQTERDGEIKRYRNVRFENTGIKWTDGKVIWRRILKDGTPTNTFAEQYHCAGLRFFYETVSGQILKDHPELKVETEKSKAMSHDDYCDYLIAMYHENRQIR